MEKESPGKDSMEGDHWGGLGLKRLLHQRRRIIITNKYRNLVVTDCLYFLSAVYQCVCE
jgi:hypothetical protein